MLDALHKPVLISSLPDIHWLTGYTGSNGLCIVDGSTVIFLTDGRYRDQAAAEVTLSSVQSRVTRTTDPVLPDIQDITIQIVSGSLLSAACRLLIDRGDGHLPELTFQADQLTVSEYRTLVDALPNTRLEGVTGLLNGPRALKSGIETAAMQRALELSEAVFLDVLGVVKEGMTELELAAEIDYRQKMRGASRSSFETIVAFGPNGALPHARPGTTRLAPHMPVLMDFGCVLNGWCSDMTRMLSLGEPPADVLKAYRIVNNAQETAVQAACAGMTSRELDAAARNVIEAAGMADAFSHSLGHGVGTEVHEWPPVSFRSDIALPESCVITIEPGVYFAGRFGIRIEDTIRLGPGGAERLNRLSTELFIL